MPKITATSLFRCTLSFMFTACFLVGTVQAQTTAFNYQGRLNDNNAQANGLYDFQFRLFDAVTSGNQIGSPIQLNGVSVTSGVFNVTLDFGGAAFPGAARFLDISVRVAGGGGSFTTLTPRRPLNSVPYAVQSLNAATATNFSGALAGDVTGTQTATTIANNAVTNAKVLDVAGSSNYIQNQNAGAQSSANFNISGDGTAGGMLSGNIVNATTQYNLNGSRVLTASGLPNQNLIVGVNAGTANTGVENVFLGFNAGNANTTGASNTFIGRRAGQFNVTGSGNTFFGINAGNTNTVGSNNTVIGVLADVSQSDITNATAIGFRSSVNCSNCLVLGSVNGANGATTNVNVGIGVSTPVEALQISGNIRVSGCYQMANGAGFQGTCASDFRFKRDITPFANILPKLTQLQPAHFYWRVAEFPDKHFGNTQSYGLIAQEVEEVLPELVSEDKQGYKLVDYSKLPLLTLQAVKELKAENDALKAQNEALKKEQAAMEARLAALEKLLQPSAPVKK